MPALLWQSAGHQILRARAAVPGSLMGAARQGPTARACPSQKQSSQEHQGTSVGAVTGQGQAGLWAHIWAWLGGVHGWAALCCGELESGPAAASQGQEVVALGLIWSSGPPAGLGSPRGGQGQAGP